MPRSTVRSSVPPIRENFAAETSGRPSGNEPTSSFRSSPLPVRSHYASVPPRRCHSDRVGKTPSERKFSGVVRNCRNQALTLVTDGLGVAILCQTANMGRAEMAGSANAGSEQSTLLLIQFAGWTPELGHPMKGRRQRLADRSGKRRLARRGAGQLPDAPHA